MNDALLVRRFEEDNAFADAIVGALRYFELFASALQCEALNADDTPDATSQLLCDALVGIASLRCTFKSLVDIALHKVDEPTEASPQAKWGREHLR